MDINLSLIQGLSREDSLLFQSESEQKTFFVGTHPTTATYNAYFPPYYTNSIKLSRDDIDFTANYNYLWFDFDGLTYYYFIDEIVYVNEDVLQLNITMDTMQTFMFHMDIHSAFVERRMIDRWDGTKINRDYVRENISASDFVQSDRKDLTSQYGNPSVAYPVMVACITNENKSGVPMKTMPGYEVGDADFSEAVYSPMSLVVCPYGCTKVQSVNRDGQGNPDTPVINAYANWVDFFEQYCSVDNCLSLYVLPFNPFIDLMVETTGNEVVLTWSQDDASLPDDTPQMKGSIPGQATWGIYPMLRTESISYDNPSRYRNYGYRLRSLTMQYWFLNEDGDYIVQNTTAGVPFSSSHIPQMIDENYMNLSFGTEYVDTTFPLHRAVSASHLSCVANVDPSTGNRFYRVVDEDDTFLDKYSTAVTDDNVLYFDMYNNAWNQYIARNRYSLAGAIGSSVVSTILGAGTASIPTSSTVASKFASHDVTNTLKQGVSRSKKTPGALTGGKTSRITNDSSGWRNSSDVHTGNAGVINAYGGGLSSLASTLIGEATKAANLMTTPSTKRISSNFNQALYGNTQNIRLKYFIKNDFASCAFYFHMCGNKVDRLFMREKDGDFLDFVNNRHYFNYVKTSYVDLHLDVLQAQSLVDDLIDRFNSGVRFWNPQTDVFIGDYHFDNVENKYL